jgi:hypothetical protein
MPTRNVAKKSRKRQVAQPQPFTLLSEIEPKSAEWLWPLRVPLGELTILDGDPGTNKSSLTIDLAARVSTGGKMPDGTKGLRGGVLLLVAEDSVSKTLRSRLEAAGANLKRVAVLNDAVTIPEGLALLERSVFRVKAKLVVIDPVMVFLGPNANTDQTVRRALTPLKELAEKTNTALVLVRHLNKSGGRRSLYRGSGSIGIIAATRSALLAGIDPKDQNMRVLCHVNSNLGPLAPSLRFEPVKTDDDVVRVEWRGECDYTPEDLLGTPKQKGEKLEDAQAFLLKLLADGPVEQGTVKAKAAEAAIAYRTVERAKEMLGLRSKRKRWGPGSKCFWQLSDQNGRP